MTLKAYFLFLFIAFSMTLKAYFLFENEKETEQGVRKTTGKMTLIIIIIKKDGQTPTYF